MRRTLLCTIGVLSLVLPTAEGSAGSRTATECRSALRRADVRLAQGLATCADSGSESATCARRAHARYAIRLGRRGCLPPRPDGTGTFVGTVEGTDALAAIVADGERVLAWVCGGPGSHDTASAWTQGTMPEGRFDLRAHGAAVRVRGQRIRNGFVGEIVLADGNTHAWAAALVRRTGAGLYLGDTAAGPAAMIVADDRAVRGVALHAGALRPVALAGGLRAAGTQRVVIDTGTVVRPQPIELPLVTTPIVELPPRIGPLPRATTFVGVKFRDGLRVRLVDGVPVDIDGVGLRDAGWDAIMGVLRNDSRWHRMHTIPEERLSLRRQVAASRLGRPMPDLNLWYVLELPRRVPAEVMVAQLHRHPDVESADYMPTAGDPPDVPDLTRLPNDVNAEQGYLEVAEQGGIDAFYAWGFHRGAGVTIVDVEYDFDGGHADLPSVELIGGAPNPGDDVAARYRAHGTSVLGIYGSRADGEGTTGIAPEASLAFASHTTGALPIPNFADAITRATDAVGEGDVMLIEAQTWGPTCGLECLTTQNGFVAVEWDKASYDAIVIAVGNGITVVEAAGNGRMDLDGDVFNRARHAGGFVHNPFDRAIDSGAILVAAGTPSASIEATDVTNFGGRIDLNGWGTGVVTTTSDHVVTPEVCDENDVDRCYSLSFTGTSAAAPIVAGAAALVQGVFTARHGRAATPAELRDLLVATGSRQATGSFKRIGPRPNLRAAVDVARGWVPAPVVWPPPGRTYDEGIEVRLDYGVSGQDLFNTLILFTLDGHEPTFYDPTAFEYVPEPSNPDVDAFLFFRHTVTLKARTFLRNVIDPATGEPAASHTLSAPYYFTEPDVGPVALSLAPGTYPVPQVLDLGHADPTATIWYTMAATADPHIVPDPELLVPGSFLFFRDIDLGASLAPVVTVKARAYVSADDGRILPGPVTTATYELTLGD